MVQAPRIKAGLGQQSNRCPTLAVEDGPHGQDACYLLSRFSCVHLFVTLRTVALQAPLPMGLSRQEYWSGLPCPPPRDLPDPGAEPTSPTSPELAGRFFTTPATECSFQNASPIWLSLLKPVSGFSRSWDEDQSANQASQVLHGLYLRAPGGAERRQLGWKEGQKHKITGCPSTPGVCISSPLPLCSDLPLTDEKLTGQPKKELENFI